MSANSFGTNFKLITFGESHGPALGAVIEGCPAGLSFDFNFLVHQLMRRRPGYSVETSARREEDLPKVLSGVFEGKTLGTPIAIIIENKDARSNDYTEIREHARAGHADDVWLEKFGHSDHRGGGRSSGRETAARVIGGAVAQMLLRELLPNLSLCAFASKIGPFELSSDERIMASLNNTNFIDAFVARFPSPSQGSLVEKLLVSAKQEGKSYGGVAELVIRGMPSGLGAPVFDKLKARFASALMSIGATAFFEVGEGVAAVTAEGSEFHKRGEGVYGGIRGGISTGEDVHLRVGFKPTSSVLDVAKKGRHDPCIVPRAIPVIEAMVALVLADLVLSRRLDRV